MRCRPNLPGAPTPTWTKCCACWRRCMPKAWSMRWMRSASALPSAAQTRRVFEAATAWACRSSCMPSSSATAAAPQLAARVWRAELRPPGMAQHRGRRGHGRAPARWRCCCPARSTSCAKRGCRRLQLLREHGVPMAVSTDCNPGSSPCTSLLLMLNMACTLFRLTPEEALAGVTRHAARRWACRPGRAGGRPARRLCAVGCGPPRAAELCHRRQPAPANRLQGQLVWPAHEF
jgi:hypothetical protein